MATNARATFIRAQDWLAVDEKVSQGGARERAVRADLRLFELELDVLGTGQLAASNDLARNKAAR
jgi:hypothetical protein